MKNQMIFVNLCFGVKNKIINNKIKNKQHWLKLRKYYLDYFYTLS